MQCLALDGEGGSHSVGPTVFNKLYVERFIWTVDFVADDPMLKFLGMHAYLVFATGLWLHATEGVAIFRDQWDEVGDGVLGAAVITDLGFDDHGAATFSAACDGEVDVERLLNFAFYKCDVGLFYDSILDRHLKLTRDSGALGKNDQSAGLAVEACHQMEFLGACVFAHDAD